MVVVLDPLRLRPAGVAGGARDTQFGGRGARRRYVLPSHTQPLLPHPPQDHAGVGWAEEQAEGAALKDAVHLLAVLHRRYPKITGESFSSTVKQVPVEDGPSMRRVSAHQLSQIRSGGVTSLNLPPIFRRHHQIFRQANTLGPLPSQFCSTHPMLDLPHLSRTRPGPPHHQPAPARQSHRQIIQAAEMSAQKLAPCRQKYTRSQLIRIQHHCRPHQHIPPAPETSPLGTQLQLSRPALNLQ